MLREAAIAELVGGAAGGGLVARVAACVWRILRIARLYERYAPGIFYRRGQVVLAHARDRLAAATDQLVAGMQSDHCEFGRPRAGCCTRLHTSAYRGAARQIFSFIVLDTTMAGIQADWAEGDSVEDMCTHTHLVWIFGGMHAELGRAAWESSRISPHEVDESGRPWPARSAISRKCPETGRAGLAFGRSPFWGLRLWPRRRCSRSPIRPAGSYRDLEHRLRGHIRAQETRFSHKSKL